MKLNDLIGAVQRGIAKSRLAVRVAMKVRNQADAIVRSRFNDGIDMSENGEQWLIKLLAPRAALFIDVGANVGEWSAEFARHMGAAGCGIAIEPSPLAIPRLREKLAAEGLADRIEVLEIAASDECGTRAFYMEPEAGETSSLVRGHSRANAESIEVRLLTLDEVIGSRGLEHVDFLKIDAEGFDLHVIRGAAGALQRHAIDVVQFEYNHPWRAAGSTLGEALEVLRRCGYSVFLLKKDGLREFDYAAYGEFFGYSNFVAVAPRLANEMRRWARGKI